MSPAGKLAAEATKQTKQLNSRIWEKHANNVMVPELSSGGDRTN